MLYSYPMEDADLLEKLKAGDKTAFNELVGLYANRVINTCYKFLLDRKDAEDISQEVFIEVYKSIKTFRGDAKLSTWIYRIAVAKSLDEIKKRNRKKRFSSIGKAVGLDQIANLLSGTEQPDKRIEEKESFSVLILVLNKLPDNQRVAFTLSKIDGYSNTEIAEIMQVSLTAVDSLIYRAKQNLKKSLSERAPDL